MKPGFPDNWYKDSFEKMNVDPPAEVWNAIADELNAGEKLTAEKRKRKTAFLFLATGPALLLSMIAILPLVSETENIYSLFNAGLLTTPEQPEAKKSVIAFTVSPGSKINFKKPLTTNTPLENHIIAIESSGSAQPTVTGYLRPQADNSLIREIEMNAPAIAILPDNKKSNVTENAGNGNDDKTPVKTRKTKHPLYIGAGGYIYNSLLLNNFTKDGFDRNSLVSNRASFTFNSSILAGISPNGKNFYQAEIIPVEKTTQNSEFFAGGYFNSQSTTLRYSRLSLQAGLLMNPKTKRHHFYLVPGLFVSNLYASHSRVSNEIASYDVSSYNKTSFGAEFSLLASYSITQKLDLSFNARLSTGISNMNGTHAESDPTRQFSLAGGFNLKYFLR